MYIHMYMCIYICAYIHACIYIYIAANSCRASCCSLASAKLVNKGDQPERQEPAMHFEYYARTCSRYAGHCSCWQRRGTNQDCGFDRTQNWRRLEAGTVKLYRNREGQLVDQRVGPPKARSVRQGPQQQPQVERYLELKTRCLPATGGFCQE